MYYTHFHEPFFNKQTCWKKLSLVAKSARYGVDLKLCNKRAYEHLVVAEIIDLPTNTPILSNGDIEVLNFEFISFCNPITITHKCYFTIVDGLWKKVLLCSLKNA